MISGWVTDEGEPEIPLVVGNRDWKATIDTGFNGDLQLPEECRGAVTCSFAGRLTWVLADNSLAEEDVFLADISFDGRQVPAIVSFQHSETALIGTHFLRDYKLSINFVSKNVELVRAIQDSV